MRHFLATIQLDLSVPFVVDSFASVAVVVFELAYVVAVADIQVRCVAASINIVRYDPIVLQSVVQSRLIWQSRTRASSIPPIAPSWICLPWQHPCPLVTGLDY